MQHMDVCHMHGARYPLTWCEQLHHRSLLGVCVRKNDLHTEQEDVTSSHAPYIHVIIFVIICIISFVIMFNIIIAPTS